MGEQDRNIVVIDPLAGTIQIIKPVVMRIIDAHEMKRSLIPSDSDRFIEQYPDPHPLECRDHPDGIVIAEHTVDRILEMGPDALHARQRWLTRAKGLVPEIPGDHA